MKFSLLAGLVWLFYNDPKLYKAVLWFCRGMLVFPAVSFMLFMMPGALAAVLSSMLFGTSGICIGLAFAFTVYGAASNMRVPVRHSVFSHGDT